MDSNTPNMPEALFQVAPWVAFGGWLLLALEYVSTLLMRPWAYRFGFRVWRREVMAGAVAVPVEGPQNVKLKQIAPGQWIFRRKVGLFDFRSPFPVRGMIHTGGGRTIVVGTHPVGGVVFLLGFALLIGVFGLFGAVATYSVSWLVEQAKFEDDWREVSANMLPESAKARAT